MSLTSTIFDKKAYDSKLLTNIDAHKYTINKNFPPAPACQPDHLNGFHSRHGNPFVVDAESDLFRLDDILSKDPYYQYPLINNKNQHEVRQTCTHVPSEEHTRLQYRYNLSELNYGRYDSLAVLAFPVHSNNVIGSNTREQGRFTSHYKAPQ
jgi:hypothetical protein